MKHFQYNVINPTRPGTTESMYMNIIIAVICMLVGVRDDKSRKSENACAKCFVKN